MHYEGMDGIGIYLSGAASDGGSQSDPLLSLGGYRSSSRVESLGVIWRGGMPNVSIGRVAGANGLGIGSLIASSTSALCWTAPGSTTIGTPVTIANGESAALFDGANRAKWIEVTRTSAAALAGVATVELVRQFNNLLGMANLTDAQREAGRTRYRAVIVLNDLEYDVTPIVTGTGISVAAETPAAGAIQTIADEVTAPSGLSWTASGSPLSLGLLTPGQSVGLWIKHVVAAAAAASARSELAFEIAALTA
jgi:hypothetical protein